MNDLPQPLEWLISERLMLKAAYWACRKLHHTIDRPGMNL
jgi:hypothetical protein